MKFDGQRAGAAVRLRDLIRSEAAREARTADQIALGVVQTVDPLEVILDGFTGGLVPAVWCGSGSPVAGDRYVLCSLLGGTEWFIIAKLGGF